MPPPELLPQEPASATALAALDVATVYSTPALLAHSLRSWCFAVGFATADGVAIRDPEALYVAALLHDIGLSAPFDAHRVPFEVAGGQVAAVLLTGAGWPPVRRERVAAIIERHMWPAVDPLDDPDGYLLEVATGLDISGSRPDALPAEYVAAVLAAYPRGALGAEFGACLTEQAARKPGSEAERLVAAGLLGRLAAHPFER